MRLTSASGQALTGHYTSRVGLHFLHRTGRDLPLIGKVTGPYEPGDVLAVEIVRTRAQVLAGAYVRLHGERVPGRKPWPAPSPRPATTGSGRCSCTASSARPPIGSA